MTPDVDLTLPIPGPHRVRDALLSLDSGLFVFAAERKWPGAGPVLPRLSRSANHGMLWIAVATAMAAGRTPRARRAAARGMASLGLASLTINTVGKRSVRRPRPGIDPVPLARRLKRQPITTSFPSGHAASAAAFATGVALESPAWGAVVAPVALSVAMSRVYTGVHFPSDVLAGAALGTGAAFAVRALVPPPVRTPPAAGPAREAAALADGAGLVLVADSDAGGTDLVAEVREALPAAEIVVCPPWEMRTALEKAAARARVLGVCGDDGTVSAAASAALRHGLPLAVLPGAAPGGFARDLGLTTVGDLAGAVRRGEATRVDVGRFRSGAREGVFLDGCGIGVHPDLVRERGRWSEWVGEWPAGMLAALRVLKAGHRPMTARVNGHERPLWLLTAGNGAHQRTGLAAGRRLDLADGLLDVQVVHGGRNPSWRLLAASAAGRLPRSPVHAAVRTDRLRLSDVEPGTLLAHDGEVTEVSGEVVLDKLPAALTVYRPRATDGSRG
ncbi:bifunctional phosphatase PAP2/diacylglycerol kinase family protein [Streptomyces doudnae]|uniref:Phosphatase PAP2 family protein n=4 Tax=Streptomyces TaxID=1883 RepID=A0ABD5EN42_9ACTN|nr:phosphatase PAP2 family protein [Streptomyces sp. DSM 41981]MDT0436103.1 phosphatase PAP2 family protein [Streptomyces sp. DSM 41981]